MNTFITFSLPPKTLMKPWTILIVYIRQKPMLECGENVEINQARSFSNSPLKNCVEKYGTPPYKKKKETKRKILNLFFHLVHCWKEKGYPFSHTKMFVF